MRGNNRKATVRTLHGPRTIIYTYQECRMHKWRPCSIPHGMTTITSLPLWNAQERRTFFFFTRYDISCIPEWLRNEVKPSARNPYTNAAATPPLYFGALHCPMNWPNDPEREARDAVTFYTTIIDQFNSLAMPFQLEDADSSETLVLHTLPTRRAADGTPILHVLFDSERTPRDQVCGATVSAAAIRYLRDMLLENRRISGDIHVVEPMASESYIVPFGSNEVQHTLRKEILKGIVAYHSVELGRCAECGTPVAFACPRCRSVRSCTKTCRRNMRRAAENFFNNLPPLAPPKWLHSFGTPG